MTGRLWRYIHVSTPFLSLLNFCFIRPKKTTPLKGTYVCSKPILYMAIHHISPSQIPQEGRSAVPLDVCIGGDSMDLTSDIGFANALFMVCNLRPGTGALAAPVCGSWIFMTGLPKNKFTQNKHDSPMTQAYPTALAVWVFSDFWCLVFWCFGLPKPNILVKYYIYMFWAYQCIL